MNHPEKKHPDHLERVSACLMPRAEAALAHPEIENICNDAVAYLSEKRTYLPASIYVVVDTEELRGLLEPHWNAHGIDARDVGPRTLFFYLPSNFNLWAILGMATQPPETFNRPQLDLRNNTTYLGWSARIGSEAGVTVVQVPAGWETSDALSAAFRSTTHEWGWMPVVMVAGDTVAVGGFVVEEELELGLQAAIMSAQSVLPEEVYSEEELAAAAEQAELNGLKPWIIDRWREDGQLTLEPEVLVRDGV